MAAPHTSAFKPSPIGPIPIDWEVKKGADISIKITKGSSPKWQGFQYQSQGLLFVTSENVRDGVLDVSDPKFLPIEFNQIQQSSILNRGDILINLVGASIGRSCIYSIDTLANINQAVCLLRLKNDVLNTFVINYLSLPACIERMLNTMSASAQPNLTLENIRDFPVPIPPYMEQEAIAKLLTTWDNAIEKTTQLITAKEQRKKWLMQQLLTGKKRLKGFGNDKWEKFSYDQLLKEVYRPIEWNDNELYKLISVRRRSGGIFLREALFGHQIKVKDLRTAQTGDFLFSKMQILHGASALVTNEFNGAKISGSYIAVVAKDPHVLQMEFLNWYSKLPYFYHQTYISSYGVTIEKMTFQFDYFLQLSLSLPSLEEQKAIVNILQTADKEISLLKQKLDAYKEQKKGLMQVLLTGKVRLKNI